MQRTRATQWAASDSANIPNCEIFETRDAAVKHATESAENRHLGSPSVSVDEASRTVHFRGRVYL